MYSQSPCNLNRDIAVLLD